MIADERVMDSLVKLQESYPYAQGYMCAVIDNNGVPTVSTCNIRYKENFILLKFFLKLFMRSIICFALAVTRNPWVYLSSYIDSKSNIHKDHPRIPINILEEVLQEARNNK